LQQRLVLAGGGHSHLLLLEQYARQAPADVELVLVCDSRWQYYSGMLPGLIAGHYRAEDCRIDLPALCRRAGCRWIEASIIAIDADAGELALANGERLSYDLLSLSVGSRVATSELQGLGDRLLAVKPFAAFVQAWNVFAQRAVTCPAIHLAVAGGGAAAVELALAARSALPSTARVSLVCGSEGILPTHGIIARACVARQLRAAGIVVIQKRVSACDGQMRLDNCELFAADAVIAATGASAPHWLRHSGLALDAAGFVQVDASHRSISHPQVFATGDVCVRVDVELARSGVHAVRVSPILAHNLLACLRNQPVRPYRPRRWQLYLLACGRRYAVASYGPLGFAGAWVWRWKDKIDRGFIASLQRI
jgi:pyridine nucleotide-disulfide oxidoreductase family protein